MGDSLKETQADTGSSSGSLQLVKSASESSCSTNTEQTLSTSEERGKKDISCFESHCVSSLKLTSSEDSRSLSSNYASTSSSHRSVDTPSTPSSPEQQIPSQFVSPRKVAPVQKHGSSSEGRSSDNAMEVSPKKRQLLHKVKFSESSGISESSGDSQAFLQQHSTPSELSSREVTHLDPPDLKSTPVEVSIDYIQLSGESLKLTTSSYSLPDPFHASPSENHLSEPCDDDNRQKIASEKEREQQQNGTGRRNPIEPLPKWVADEKQKQMDFGSMQSSESINSAGTLSSSVASSLRGCIFQNTKVSSVRNENALLSASPEFLVEDSQGNDVENLDEEDIRESCLYDEQECPKNVSSTSADLIPATGTTKGGLSGRISDSHGAIMSSPILLEISKSFAVSSSTQASQGVSMLPYGSPSDLQSQKEEEAFKIKHSKVIHESVVTEKLHNEASTPGKDKDLAGENCEESPVSKGICSYVPDMERSNKELSPAHTSMTKDMELEMSQDLFNEKLEQIDTPDYDQLSVVQDTGVEVGDQDFKLFLSQTQNVATPSLDPVPVVNEAASACPSCIPSQTKEELTLKGQQNSFDNTLATPSQSILSSDRKIDLSLPITASVNAEMGMSQAEGLDIPKDVLSKVSSNELSLSNHVHISPTSDDGPFRPVRTLTPPMRNVTLIDEPCQDVCNKSTADQSKEPLTVAHVTECLLSTAMESRMTKRTDTSKEHSSIPASIASSSNSPDLQSAKDVSSRQGSTFSSRSVETVTKVPKRSHPASSVEGDPFAFSEEDAMESKMTRRPATRKQHSSIPTSSASPSNSLDLRSVKDVSSKQGSTISSRTVETETRAPKRSHPASSVEGDPFAFNEEDNVPQTKTRRIAIEPSKTSPKLKMPETKANSEGEALCKLVNRIVTTKEIIVKETRRFITEAVSIDDLDDTVYQRTEFIENGVPSKSVSEDCQTESVEVVPISSLDATRVGQQIKKKKTPPKRKKTKVRELTKGEEERLKDEKLVAFEAAETRSRSNAKRESLRSIKSCEVDAPSIDVGMYGLGKWLDNRYYPGKVIEVLEQGRYKVRFHDGRELLLDASFIKPQHTIQPGQSVCARDSKDGYYYRGTIHGIDRAKNGIHSCYHIKLDDTRKFDASEIMLDSKQISQLTTEDYNSFKKKEESSIADAQSQAERKNSEKEARLPDPEPSVTKKKTIKSVRTRKGLTKERTQRKESARLLFSSSSSASDPFQFRMRPKRRKIEPSSEKRVTPPGSEQAHFMEREVDDRVKKSRDRGEEIIRLKSGPKIEEIIKKYGPLPQNPRLFKGYSFLFTYIRPKSTLETAFICKDFKRSHLACQITAGGGVIIESVKNLQPVSKKNFILIAPESQKTIKYYFALCYGVPCLSHSWVVACCTENRLLPFDNYLLEAGIDEITESIIPHHRGMQPLRGYKIYVKAIDPYQEELSLAVKFSGAELLHKLPEVKSFCPGDLDFILVGENIVLKRDFISLTKKLDVPCVTVKWFFQCIVHGEFINPETSELFLALRS